MLACGKRENVLATLAVSTPAGNTAESPNSSFSFCRMPVGGSKKPAPGATRKWARQVRWHERASQAASVAGARQQPDQAPAPARSSVNPTLLAAMQQQQRTDRCRAPLMLTAAVHRGILVP